MSWLWFVILGVLSAGVLYWVFSFSVVFGIFKTLQNLEEDEDFVDYPD